MPPGRTSRQTWAQQRIDEVYADNGHPYFARDDRRKGRLNAAMYKLHQETTPAAPRLPGQQVSSAANLLGGDAFATAEEAASYLSQAAGKGAAPKLPGTDPGRVAEGRLPNSMGSRDIGEGRSGQGKPDNTGSYASGPVNGIGRSRAHNGGDGSPFSGPPNEIEESMTTTTIDIIDVTLANKKLQYDPFGSKEYNVALRNPPDAHRAVSLAKAARKTIERLIKAGRLPSGRPHNNAADAFRHAFWSYQMANQLKAQGAAKEIGDAHERNNPLLAGERYMDLYNNAVGRQLAADPANAGRSDEQVIMKALRDGKLRITPFNVPTDNHGEISKSYGGSGR